MFGNFTKEEKAEWDKVNGNKKGSTSKGFYFSILWVIIIISFLSGIGTLSVAKSAIHEIYASISFLITTISFCTVAIISKIDSLK